MLLLPPLAKRAMDIGVIHVLVILKQLKVTSQAKLMEAGGNP
jgi:hypothetical protein